MADDLKKIKELLEVVNNKVGKLETHVSIHTSTMHAIKDQQSVMNEKLDNLETTVESTDKRLKRVEEKVDALSGDIEQLHDDVKGIRDKEGLFHSRNKREIDEIKTHIGIPLIPDIPEV